MRQLIARVDDELHARLKARAAAEKRSLNALVNEALRTALEPAGERARLRERLRRAGKLVEPPMPDRYVSRDEAIESGRGAGTAVSEALEEDRNAR